ncbi:ISA2 Iron-sulfur assembly protein 2 [Candida maltosa Xu316]|uniref:Iron sulfur assembly protein, putative n=1 Tax=Candida maltosa (strain Xu316) TaxID=1245528 RepID=M3IGN9_CANMX|nr:Iron sulfur assembly protein, putative [Candida maltosa Xu316]
MISRIRLKQIVPRSITPLIQIPIRFNATKTTPILKPSSFAIPSQPTPSETTTNDPVLTQDIADFKATKLIHGTTNLHIGITERARDKLLQIATEDKNPDSGLFIKVESGGCHGFQYNLNLTDVSKELAKESDLLVFEREKGKIVLDESSLMILQDSKLDYTKELIGSQFKIVDSPYTSSSCGCGSSFDFDFEKLSQKQE